MEGSKSEVGGSYSMTDDSAFTCQSHAFVDVMQFNAEACAENSMLAVQ